MPTVREVMAASIFAGSMLRVAGSQSTSTTLPPAIQIASAVAKKVFAVVMTSSPSFRPRAMKVSQRASVPEFTPIACFVPEYRASSCSNCFRAGPMTYWLLSRTLRIASSISFLMLRYCRT